MASMFSRTSPELDSRTWTTLPPWLWTVRSNTPSVAHSLP